MPKQKYQRPKVKPAGTREKLWRVEYREYYTLPNGEQASRHKSKTWNRTDFTKAEAQAACDKFLREMQAGPPKADGNMTVAQFWDECYYPVRIHNWETNTRRNAEYLWRKYINPALGKLALADVTKVAVSKLLISMAEAGLGWSSIKSTWARVHSLMDEAMENDYIVKNPARRVELPRCKKSEETRSLTVEEVKRIWDKSEGRDYILWRLLIMTGLRIGEALALTKQDITVAGIWISKSAKEGKAGTTKNKKSRMVPIEDTLRAELEEYTAGCTTDLLFATDRGKMMRRNDKYVCGIEERARTAAAIPDLNYRNCRTTFATLFDGDVKDLQAALGHHSAIFTLMVYKKAQQDRTLESVRGLSRLLYAVPKKKVG